MMQKALKSANPKTENEVKNVVAIMAKNFSIDIDSTSSASNMKDFNL